MSDFFSNFGPWLGAVAAFAGGYFVRSFDPVARVASAWSALTKPKE